MYFLNYNTIINIVIVRVVVDTNPGVNIEQLMILMQKLLMLWFVWKLFQQPSPSFYESLVEVIILRHDAVQLCSPNHHSRTKLAVAEKKPPLSHTPAVLPCPPPPHFAGGLGGGWAMEDKEEEEGPQWIVGGAHGATAEWKESGK